jgi:hypothetical protein
LITVSSLLLISSARAGACGQSLVQPTGAR